MPGISRSDLVQFKGFLQNIREAAYGTPLFVSLGQYQAWLDRLVSPPDGSLYSDELESSDNLPKEMIDSSSLDTCLNFLSELVQENIPQHDENTILGSGLRSMARQVRMLQNRRSLLIYNEYVQNNSLTFLSHAISMGGADMRLAPQVPQNNRNQLQDLQRQVDNPVVNQAEPPLTSVTDPEKLQELKRQVNNPKPDELFSDLNSVTVVVEDLQKARNPKETMEQKFVDMGLKDIWKTAGELYDLYEEMYDKKASGQLTGEVDAQLKQQMKDKATQLQGHLEKAQNTNLDDETNWILFDNNKDYATDSLKGARGISAARESLEMEMDFLNSGLPLAERDNFGRLLGYATQIEKYVLDSAQNRYAKAEVDKLVDSIEEYRDTVRNAPEEGTPEAIQKYYQDVSDAMDRLRLQAIKVYDSGNLDQVERGKRAASLNQNPENRNMGDQVARNKMHAEYREKLNDMGKLEQELRGSLTSGGQPCLKQSKERSQDLHKLYTLAYVKENVRIVSDYLKKSYNMRPNGRTAEFLAFKDACDEVQALNERSEPGLVVAVLENFGKAATTYKDSKGLFSAFKDDGVDLYHAAIKGQTMASGLVNAMKKVTSRQTLDALGSHLPVEKEPLQIGWVTPADFSELKVIKDLTEGTSSEIKTLVGRHKNEERSEEVENRTNSPAMNRLELAANKVANMGKSRSVEDYVKALEQLRDAAQAYVDSHRHPLRQFGKDRKAFARECFDIATSNLRDLEDYRNHTTWKMGIAAYEKAATAQFQQQIKTKEGLQNLTPDGMPEHSAQIDEIQNRRQLNNSQNIIINNDRDNNIINDNRNNNNFINEKIVINNGQEYFNINYIDDDEPAQNSNRKSNVNNAQKQQKVNNTSYNNLLNKFKPEGDKKHHNERDKNQNQKIKEKFEEDEKQIQNPLLSNGKP